MIGSENGGIWIECDECGQHFGDWEDDAFSQMIDNAKKCGWHIRPDGDGGWTHLCPACKPTGLEAQRKLLGL